MDRIEHHFIEVLARLLQLIEQMLAHLIQLLACELLIQVVRRAPELFGAVVPVELQDAVLYFPAVDDQDRQHPVVGERYELDLAQRRVVLARQGHDPSEARHARQQLGGRGHDRLGVVRVFPQTALNGRDLVVLQRLELEQGIDEEAIALVGRDAAGGGMGRGDEAELFEVGHDVADRGGAELEADVAGQSARTDGLAVANVMLHQQLEQLLRAFVQNLIARLDGHVDW